MNVFRHLNNVSCVSSSNVKSKQAKPLNFEDNPNKQIEPTKPHNPTFDKMFALERLLEYENADSSLTDTDTMVQ